MSTPTTKSRHPVIIATGEKSLDELDFQLPGPIELEWRRQYRSGDARSDRWFGQGWSHPLATEIWIEDDVLRYWDEQGREVVLPAIAVGQEHFQAYEQFTLTRPNANHWALRHNQGLTHHFRRRHAKQWRLPLEVIQDRNLRRILLQFNDLDFGDRFDPQGALPRPPRLIDSAGRTLHLLWTDHKQLREVVVASGDFRAVMATYRYGSASPPAGGSPDLISHTDPNGNTRTYAWDQHLLVGYTLATGQRFSNRYDRLLPTGRVIESLALDDGTGDWFDYNGRTTRVRDRLGRETVYVHNARQDIVAVHDAEGNVTRNAFDAAGRPEGSTDALGRASSTTFDARGNLTLMTDAAGNATSVEYNPQDLPIKLTDAMGGEWLRKYDERGNLIESTDPLGQTTRYEVDIKGRAVAIIDALGKRKTLEWDEADNLVAYTDCSGYTTRYTYDELGHLRSTTDALSQTTHLFYDALGQLIQLVEPNGATHRNEWDGQGNMVMSTDALGRVTRWRCNGLGQLLEQIDAVGNCITVHYDVAGRPTILLNEKGESTRFRYNRLDHLTDEIGFDGRHQRYCRNAAGELTHVVERGGSQFGPGRVTRFERDNVGNVRSKVYVGAEQELSAGGRFAYDKLNRLISASNGLSTVSIKYNLAGRVVEEIQTVNLPGQDVRAFALQHEYDALGNRTRTVLPNGKVLSQQFYGSGHLHQVTLDGQEVSGFERDALHREVRRSQGSLSSQFAYDAGGRLVAQRVTRGLARQPVPAQMRGVDRTEQIEHVLAGLIDRYYEYDLAGQLLSWKDSVRGVTRYRYDALNRVTESRIGELRGRTAIGPADTPLVEQFAWDAASNPLDITRSGDGQAVSGDRVYVYEDARYEYDEYGNLVERLQGKRGSPAETRTKLSWDAANQLAVSYVQRGAGSTCTTQSFSYAYDALGRRIAKTDAFGTTYFAWDGERLLLDSRGGNATYFFYKPGTFLPLAQFHNDTLHHLHTDQLGTPLEATNDSGQLTWKVTYRTWGSVVTEEVAEITQRLRYQGQYFDEETGLHYNRYRYYDPFNGRYVSQDPLGLPANSNLYRYCANPTGWVDPLGLAGNGGAYIFEMKNGDKYVGKGEEGRFQESKKLRGGGTCDCNIVASAHVETDGDNELGKMVEYKTMILSGFKEGMGRGAAPPGFLNAHLSGASAWKANPGKQARATELAKELLEKFKRDKAARACNE